MKLGVITDGISRNLSDALSVMDEFDIDYAELQYIGDKEVGDLTADERQQALDLIEAHGKKTSCISRHLFAGMVTATTRPGDSLHTKHIDALKRCVDMAHQFQCPLVRIMTGKKEMILWGSNGAEKWNVAHGAWDAQLSLIAPAIDIARDAGITLAVETGNGTMVNSCFMARRLVDDLDAKDVLKVLWDPANNCWCGEDPIAEGYPELRDGYLGHMHIKDVHADPVRSHLAVRPMGAGQLAHFFPDIASSLRSDNYQGVISFESVYHPGDGDFEAGFRSNYLKFREYFHP